jgi:anti-anti-sigma factor
MPLTTASNVVNGIATITLAGRLDGATSPRFLAEIQKVVLSQPAKLVLDLKDLEFMASAGLRVLIIARQKLPKVPIFAVSPQEPVKDAIEISGFHQGMTVLDHYDAEKIEEKKVSPAPPAHPATTGKAPTRQVTLPGILDSLEPMSVFLREASQEAGLDSKVAGRLTLAVDEWVTNVITHGYHENGLSGDVILRSEVTPQDLIITVIDTAVPFDPRTLAKPTSLDLPLEERPIGGVGVYLMLRSVDEYRYDHTDGKNSSTFIVKRHAK